MSNRSIYVGREDWERWKDTAWRSRLSVSEMIRKAVEAFDAGYPPGYRDGRPHSHPDNRVQARET